MRANFSGESPWIKLLVVLVLAIAGTFLFLFLGMLLLPLFFNLQYADLPNILTDLYNPGSIEVLKFLQGFNTIGTFLFPAMIAAYLFSHNSSEYLRIDTFPSGFLVVVSLLLIISMSGVVVSDLLYRLSTQIPFPDFLTWIKEYLDNAQQIMHEQIAALLQMENFMDFAEVFIILAVLPAVCEESLFRGVLQKLFISGVGNVHLGIFITSLIFGLLHQQFYSFLSIVALSVVLGYLKEWSGSLWVPVIMHLINNGSIIVGVYYFDVPVNNMQESSDGLSSLHITLGLLFFAAAMAAAYFQFRKGNRRLPE